jgi:hypothetical protein
MCKPLLILRSLKVHRVISTCAVRFSLEHSHPNIKAVKGSDDSIKFILLNFVE